MLFVVKPRIEVIQNETKSRNEDVSLDCRYTGDGEVLVEWIFKGTIMGAPDSNEYAQVEIPSRNGQSRHGNVFGKSDYTLVTVLYQLQKM